MFHFFSTRGQVAPHGFHIDSSNDGVCREDVLFWVGFMPLHLLRVIHPGARIVEKQKSESGGRTKLDTELDTGGSAI
jgi:hypothetical protein